MAGERYLLDWSMKYMRHRDMHAKAILDVMQQKDSLIIEEKEGMKLVLCSPFLGKDILAGHDSAGYVGMTIVTYNTKTNVESLNSVWKQFSEIKTLTIIFLNPLMEDNKWMIKPYVHNRFTEPGAIRKGLLSLMENCGEMTESDFSRVPEP